MGNGINKTFIKLGLILVIVGVVAAWNQEHSTYTQKIEQEKIEITLRNDNCWDEDFYVDDKRVTNVSAKSSTNFKVSPGSYTTKVCTPGTSNCGSAGHAIWTMATTQTLEPHPDCLKEQKLKADIEDEWATDMQEIHKSEPKKIEITLRNDNCLDQDFYVDAKLVASVSAQSSTIFRVSPGTYTTKACTSGTSNCGASFNAVWTMAATLPLIPHPDCTEELKIKTEQLKLEKDRVEKGKTENVLNQSARGLILDPQSSLPSSKTCRYVRESDDFYCRNKDGDYVRVNK